MSDEKTVDHRIGALESAYKGLRDDNIEMRQELGHVRDGLVNLRSEISSQYNSIQQSMSDAVQMIQNQRIEDHRAQKVPWVPILGMIGGALGFVITIGTLIVAPLNATDSRTSELLESLTATSIQNSIDVAVEDAENDRLRAEVDDLRSQIRDLRRQQYEDREEH